MSIVELRWWEEGHFSFSKQNIFLNLEGTVPEARSKDMEAPWEDAIALPATAFIGSVEPCPAKTQGQVTTSLHHQDAPPMMSPHPQRLPPHLLVLTYLGLQEFPWEVAQ